MAIGAHRKPVNASSGGEGRFEYPFEAGNERLERDAGLASDGH